MAEKLDIQVNNGIGYIKEFNGTIEIGTKNSFIPTFEWAKEKIENSLNSIGARYITYNKKEYEKLNQSLHIQNIFDFITYKDVDFDKLIFIISSYKPKELEQRFDEFADLFNQYCSKSKNINNSKEYFKSFGIDISLYEFFEENYEDMQKIYYSKELIIKFIEKIKECLNGKKNILFSNEFLTLLKQIQDLINIVNKYKNSKNIQSDDYGYRYFNYLISFNQLFSPFYDFFNNKNLNTSKYVNDINIDNILSTYLFKHTLITGEAMSGKTHMLSDIAKNRIKNNKPTILIYAQNFEGYDRPIQHIIKQLQLEQFNYSDEEFLLILNEWGKSTNELVFLIIDAINETTNKKIWKNNFIEFVNLVKKYTSLALIMSIRDVEKDWLFNDNTNLYISKNMIEIEHKGFKEIEFSVLKKFCAVFGIKIPTFALLSPIFANPGLLFLFFETLKRNGIQEIDEFILKPNFIINEYIKNCNIRFKERFQIENQMTYVHNTTNIVTKEIIENNLKEEVAYNHIYAKTQIIHPNILDYLISDGVFLTKKNTVDEMFIYFSYQRFGNYFIALYLLPEDLLAENIQKNEIIKKLLRNFHNYKMIVEALIIRLNETHKIDIKEIFNDFFIDSELNKFRYECLNKSLDIPEINKNELINVFSSNFEEQTMRLDNLLQNSVNFKSDLNISQNLHGNLLSMKITERDYYWSIYIHNSYINDGIVNQIINWAWNKNIDFEINDNSLYLYGLTLGWFLTSSNRELRDATTKALVNIFTDNIGCFLDVLKEFNSVNDLYIKERLYAVAYGITLRSDNQNGYKELAEYIYNSIFNVAFVIEHIMIRDYAKLTVEYIYSLIKLDIDINKVKPPYRSILPDILPTDEEIDSYEKKSGKVYDILRSMITESGRSGNYSYGDFGRYTFQSNLKNFKLENLRIQDLSNYAVKIIIEEMIDDKELFSQAESNLRNISYSRNEHKVERIGKKYQWIAFYKILALVSDNYKIIDRTNWDDVTEEYKGTFQLSCRNIDPTSILRNQIESKYQWWLGINQNFECQELNDKEWMGSNKNLPKISDIVNISFENKNYLLMDTSFSIDGNKENDKYRNLYYCINSFILKKENLETFISWANNQVFYARKMPESSSFYRVFLREYPFGEAYDSINNYYNSQMSWETTFDNEEDTLPCEVLLTSTSYMNEASGYDNSVENIININLPNKWIIEKMNLRQSLNDGEWIDKNQNIIFLDKGTNNEKKALLADKEKLLEFLDNNEYTICWIMWGEKQVRDSQGGFNEKEFLGISELNSFSYLKNNNIVDSEIQVDFKI